MSLVTIFSPSGEQFEVTSLNARDLTSHAGWTYERLVAAATPTPPPPPAPKPVDTAPAPTPAPAADESTATETETPAPEAFDAEAAAARYGALDKADLVHLLKDQFGFDADGRTSLPKLVAKAVELEKAAHA